MVSSLGKLLLKSVFIKKVKNSVCYLDPDNNLLCFLEEENDL